MPAAVLDASHQDEIIQLVPEDQVQQPEQEVHIIKDPDLPHQESEPKKKDACTQWDPSITCRQNACTQTLSGKSSKGLFKWYNIFLCLLPSHITFRPISSYLHIITKSYCFLMRRALCILYNEPLASPSLALPKAWLCLKRPLG